MSRPPIKAYRKFYSKRLDGQDNGFGTREVDFDQSLAALGVGLRRGGRVLFANLNFELAPGEFLLITGPNGAGKTSLLRTIPGLLRLSEGAFTASSPATASKTAAPPSPEAIHFIGHLNAIKPQLTGLENLSFWRDFLAAPAGGPQLRVEQIMEFLDLSHLAQVPVAYFSAGQSRRLAMLRLLVAPRALWLLDEPMNALDGASRSKIAQMIDQHRDSGGIVIAASHDEIGAKPSKHLSLGNALP